MIEFELLPAGPGPLPGREGPVHNPLDKIKVKTFVTTHSSTGVETTDETTMMCARTAGFIVAMMSKYHYMPAAVAFATDKGEFKFEKFRRACTLHPKHKAAVALLIKLREDGIIGEDDVVDDIDVLKMYDQGEFISGKFIDPLTGERYKDGADEPILAPEGNGGSDSDSDSDPDSDEEGDAAAIARKRRHLKKTKKLQPFKRDRNTRFKKEVGIYFRVLVTKQSGLARRGVPVEMILVYYAGESLASLVEFYIIKLNLYGSEIQVKRLAEWNTISSALPARDRQRWA